MHLLATRRWLLAGALVVVGALGAGNATAQQQQLGDDFIFFVNGPNVLVPTISGTPVEDPLAPGSGDMVLQMNYANWATGGFRFIRNEGVDLTQNVGAGVGEGDTLFLRLMSSPANAGKGGISITFFDKTDDSPARDGSADLEFRLQWPLPDWIHDGQWHDLTLPLPPATSAALDSAKVGKLPNGEPLTVPIDTATTHWTYGGTWSGGGFGVWNAQDPLWKEFEWGAVNGLTIFWDNGSSGGPIYIDNVYIGGPGKDLSVASAMPTAMSNVTFTADGENNVVSWVHNPEFGAYNVYVSENPITDVTAPGVVLLKKVTFDATDFSVRHPYEVPYPALANQPLYYAVTSMSQFGVENPNVAQSSGQIINTGLSQQAAIIELTADESDILFNNVSNGTASAAGFPDFARPFVLAPGRWRAGDSPRLPDDATDLSAKLWIGYTTDNELFIYAEVTDDSLQMGRLNHGPGEFWQFDSIEWGFGYYDVRQTEGGSPLVGSTHTSFQRGEQPDYQLRIAPRGDVDGNIIGSFAFASTFTGAEGEGEVPGGDSAADLLRDENGNVIGWKMLAYYPLNGLVFNQPDVIANPPTSDEMRLVPMLAGFNDADGSGREHQVLMTLKPTAGSNWWSNPSTWPSVAMLGRNLATGVEQVADELPGRFALDQNYPNPFNPATTISFSLANQQRVTLTVYNLLGQRVTTLIDGDLMAQGQYRVTFDARSLASGTYFYRLEAGTSFVETRRMTLIK